MLRRRTCSHQLFDFFSITCKLGELGLSTDGPKCAVYVPRMSLTVWGADSRSRALCCWALTPQGASTTSHVFSYYFQVKESPSDPCRLKSFRSPKDWMDLTWCFKIFWQKSERKRKTSAAARFKGLVSRTGHLWRLCHCSWLLKIESK